MNVQSYIIGANDLIWFPRQSIENYEHLQRLFAKKPGLKVIIKKDQGMSKWSWYVNKKGDVVEESADGEEVPWGNLGEAYGSAGDAGYTRSCEHVWVNVGFHHITMACKTCGADAPGHVKPE